jgi:hypothetical protein
MMKYQIILLTLAITSCSSYEHARIGQPSCDNLIPVTQQIWDDLNLLREAMSHNQLAYEECVEKLRSRIRLHDENR